MDDHELIERLRGVDRVPTPELWSRIGDKQSDIRSTRPTGRVVVVLVALAVSVLTWLVVASAFRNVQTANVGPRPNGLVVYADVGPDPESTPFRNMDLFAFDPATGMRWNLTKTPNIAEEAPVWSEDGSRVVYQRVIATGEGSSVRLSHDIVVAAADGSGAHVLERCEGPCEWRLFSWSPDGRQIAWTGSEPVGGGGFVIALGIFDVASGERRILCDSRSCSAPNEPTWSPDGTRVAFTGGGGRGVGLLASPVSLASVDGSVEPLTSAPAECSFNTSEQCIFDGSPAWSPDGKRLAYVRSIAGGVSRTMIVDVEARSEEIVSTCAAGDQCRRGPVVWTPDGSAIAFVERYDRPVLSVVTLSSGARAEVPFDPAIDYPSMFSWSPDQEELTFLGGPGRRVNLYAVDIDSATVREVAHDVGEGSSVAWLPAGEIVTAGLTPLTESADSVSSADAPPGTVFFASSNAFAGEDSATEIWSIATDGSGLKRLTANDEFDGSPSASPDGSVVAFRGYREGLGNTQLWVMSEDGTNPRVLTRGSAGVGEIAFSPVEDVIAFAWGGDRDHPNGLYIIRADGTGLQLVAEGNTFDPAWSPDGSRIVFADDRFQGDLHLYIVDVALGTVTQLTDLDGAQMSPTWSPQSDEIVFEWSSGGGSELFSIAPNGHGLTELFEGSEPSWSPEGTWLAFTRFDDETGSQIWLARRDGSDARALTTMPGFIEGTAIEGITGSPWWSSQGS